MTTHRSRLATYSLIGVSFVALVMCCGLPTGFFVCLRGVQDAVNEEIRREEGTSPESAEIESLHREGENYFEMGNYQEAVESYTRLIELDSNNADSYEKRGSACDKIGEYDRAILDFTEAIRCDPESALAFHYRGVAKRNKDEHEAAIADYNEAIRLDPKDGEVYLSRAASHFLSEDYDEAIADSGIAIVLGPDELRVRAHLVRGIVYEAKNECGRALSDYAAGLSLDPDNTPLLETSARLRATCPSPEFLDGQEAIRRSDSLSCATGGS